MATFGGFPFDPEIFTGFVSERDPVNPNLIRSGVLRPAPKSVAAILRGNTNVATIPFYKPFSGDAENYDGETDNTPVLTSGDDMSCMSYGRMKAWKEQDFTIELTGANDLANVAGNIGNYRAKENEKALLSILTGLEGVSDFADHVNALARTTTGTVDDANRLTPSNAADAMRTALGDHANEFQIWIMHSSVYNDLKKQGFAYDQTIKFKAQQGSMEMPTFLNKIVIQDDSLTATANATTGLTDYHTYLMGTGAFISCEIPVLVPSYVAYDAESGGGVTKLYYKWRRLIHPYGFSFLHDNVAKKSPTNTEFATSANWEQLYESKNIPIVSFITNVE